VRFVFDHHDLCPEIYRTRFGDGGPVLRALLALERATFFAADHVITTNDSYRGRAQRRGRRRPDETTVVRSGPRAGELRPGEPEPALRRGHRHLCCYLGIMGHQDGVETVVRAADLIVNEWGRRDIAFALLGYGDTLEDLRRLTTSLGLDDHVAFTGRVGTAEIQRYLATADLGLSPDPRSPFNEVSTMNKTIEYMACGLPVAAFDLHETRVSAGDAARYAPGDDVRSFAKLVVSLVDDPDLRAEMGRAGRRAVEEGLCWEAQAPAYVGAYDRLFGHGPVAATGSVDPAVTGASVLLSVSAPSGALVGEESP
jgi:glycosyltransferase involved in cell wall biosynthesis